MRIIRYHQHGTPEVLQVDEVEKPEPGPGQVRIRAEATFERPGKERLVMSSVQRRLVRDMVRIRCVEETLADLYREEQQMRTPTHFSIGQEATSVGICAAARRTDVVYSGHRSHAPYLAKGGDLDAMVAELYGKVSGCAGGRGGSVHLMDKAAGFGGSAAILGEMIPVAVGAAWAFAMEGAPRVALTFFGDGASEEARSTRR
nr:thiamine pyrophosphate-dependent enzyme [Streptomyces sp. ISL-99]